MTLRNCQVSYYKDSLEHKPIKVVNRDQIQSYSKISDREKWHFGIYTRQKVIHFRCIDSNEFNTWMHSLHAFLSQDSDIPKNEIHNEIEESQIDELDELPEVNINEAEQTILKGDIILRKHYNHKLHSVVTNRAIYFHKKNSLYKQIPMSDIIDVIEWDPKSNTKLWCFLIITVTKRFRVCVETEKDLGLWMNVLTGV